MAKNIRSFLENLFEYYFLNIIVNVNFFGDLKFEYYWALPWNTATSKPWNIFWKNYWAMKYLGLWSPGLRIFFFLFEKFVKSSAPPPPTYLMYASLVWGFKKSNVDWINKDFQIADEDFLFFLKAFTSN